MTFGNDLSKIIFGLIYMKKLLFTCFLTITGLISAQTTIFSNSSPWVLGGTAHFGWGSGGRYSVGGAPEAGYKITPNLVAGIRPGFTYEKNLGFNSKIFNVGAYTNYYFYKRFFTLAEFQEYFIHFDMESPEPMPNKNESALYLGLGYSIPVGATGGIQVGFAYNVLYKKNHNYLDNRFVPTIGVAFGL